jgi:deoxyribonuclease-1-like protein
MFRKYLLLFFLLCHFSCYAQYVAVCSWNLKDFGRSKSEETLKIMAATLKTFDVIALQEVVPGPAGPQAVARLVDQLNRTGHAWSYTVSLPTSGTAYSSERYAFIWKTKKIKKIGDAWLEKKYAAVIDREPYLARFQAQGCVFTLVNFHAIPKAKQPETEIKYLKFFPGIYPKDNLLFCGDFNLSQSHSVYNPLKKMGFQSALVAQKTSLRQNCIQNDCLASEFDNFFFNSRFIKLQSAGILHFYKAFETLKLARKVSDHVPIYFNFNLAL